MQMTNPRAPGGSVNVAGTAGASSRMLRVRGGLALRVAPGGAPVGILAPIMTRLASIDSLSITSRPTDHRSTNSQSRKPWSRRWRRRG
ncbi:MAG: hypothetical protein JNN03_13360 [Rubrivivax sp.]|nr:hypothetical protein [Rubrivivax sp.]